MVVNIISSQKTPIPEVPKNEDRKWYFLDLKNQVPGRVSTKIAILLRGKQERLFSPNVDLGNNVVLINASKVSFTGNKLNEYHYNHSGYPGNLRQRSNKEMLEKYSTELIWDMVWGMMPKNKFLSRKQMTRLHIFPNEKHDKQAQEKNFNIIKMDKKSK